MNPIVLPGQVFLHTALNEYVVVTDVKRGDISYKGLGLSGHNEIDLFLERFGPVNPVDLTEKEYTDLATLTPARLSIGWVKPEDWVDGEEDEEE
jgi:hypothetical protein